MVCVVNSFVNSLFLFLDSPEGFQSSESFMKQWNERRPKIDDNSAKNTFSKAKKPRKSGKSVGGKATSKPSRKTGKQQGSSTEAVSRCDSNYDTGSESSEVQGTLDCDQAFNCEDMYSDGLSDFLDNVDEDIKIGDEDGLSVAISEDTGKAFKMSDKTVAIEISDNSEEQGISNDNGEVFKSSDTGAFNHDRREDLSKEITVVEKKANFSPTSCYEDIFGDDSSMDDELCDRKYREQFV